MSGTEVQMNLDVQTVPEWQKLFNCMTIVYHLVNHLQGQTKAVGHRYAPSNSDIYMSEWEQEVLSLNVFQNEMGAWLHGPDSSQQPSSFC